MVFGAVMRTPADGLINIKFPMASTDEYDNGIHIGLKERAREWKIFIIPLTETELQNNSENLDINIELVKRRWQQNIQIVSKQIDLGKNFKFLSFWIFLQISPCFDFTSFRVITQCYDAE